MAKENTFFRDLVNNDLINEWAENIDWLLNDNKFDKWNINDKKHYTKMIKNLLKSNSIDYRKLKIDEIEKIKTKNQKYAYINSGSSESLDFIRHIRNGIAHGNCNIKRKDKVLYLFIVDYNKNQKNVTARLSIPISLIKDIRLLYKKVHNK